MKNRTLTIGILSAAITLIACESKNKNDQKSEEKEKTEQETTTKSESTQDDSAVPEGAKVYFVNLADGDAVQSPFKVEFGIEGMDIEPAGELIPGTGHHHIIIDGGPINKGVVVPADSLNIHYGKGQTEAELNLPKGEHTLTLQFADGYHQSYGKQMSATVLIQVD